MKRLPFTPLEARNGALHIERLYWSGQPYVMALARTRLIMNYARAARGEC